MLDVIVYPTDCCPMLEIRLGTNDINVVIRDDAKRLPFPDDNVKAAFSSHFG